MSETFTVVIIGSGVAGLTLGNILLKQGVHTIILEHRSQEYVLNRQRAGVIDVRAIRMFRRWGMEKDLFDDFTSPPLEPILHFIVDGKREEMPFSDKEIVSDGRFCPQKVLVMKLMDLYIKRGGDLRFNIKVNRIINLENCERTEVHYQDPQGNNKALFSQFIAGCDGNHGISRKSIPSEILKTYEYDFGYAWLTVLLNGPAKGSALMSIHNDGFAAQFARGPNASRLYLQCSLQDSKEDWTTKKIWDEFEKRTIQKVDRSITVTEKHITPLRSLICEPISFRRLFLLGDAAHIIPPMSAKGMNLALFDADLLAEAILLFFNKKDNSLLQKYSEKVISHTWNYQAFALWWTNIIHNAGDESYKGEFQKKIAQAELKRLFGSNTTSNQLLGEFMTGLNGI